MESFTTLVSPYKITQHPDDLTDDIEDKNASYLDYSQSKLQSTQNLSTSGNSTNSDNSNRKKKKKKSVFS